MSAPTFVLQGSALSSLGGGDVVWPTGHQADDIGVLMIQTANQPMSTPSGWTLIESTGVGTAGVAGSVAIQAFWKRAASAAEANVTLGDAGDHLRARILLFRGCETSGSPIEGTPVTTISGSDTDVEISMPTTTVVDCYGVGIVANATDTTANQTTVPSWVNAGLSGFTRIANGNTDVGVGGGIDAGGGVKALAGAISLCNATLNTASNQAKIGFALKPPAGVVVLPVTEGGIYVATGIKATAGAASATTATLDTAAVQARLTFALKPPTAPPVNLPPVVDPISAILGAVNTPVQFPIVASDPEGLDLTLTLVAAETDVPSGASIIQDDLSGLYSFEWTPTTGQAGEWFIAVQVSDGTNTVTRPIEIVIQAEQDQTLLELATALATRAQTDLESARALADLIDQREQMNAKVINDIKTLVEDLQVSADYMQTVLDQLEEESDPQ